MKLVRFVMTTPVKSMKVGTSIAEAIEFFSRHEISGAPIVNEAGFAVGILSRSNLVSNESFQGKLVQDLMTPFVFDVHPNQTVLEVAKTMMNLNIHRVIITENQKPVGVLTSLDVVREFVAEHQAL